MRRGGKQACQRRHRHLCLRKGKGEKNQRSAIETDEPLSRVLAKQTRSRMHADDGVIFLVLMGVDGIVSDHPKDRTAVKENGRQAEFTKGRRPAHECAPGKCKPQNELRPVRYSLREWVDRDDSKRSNAEQSRKTI